MPIYEYRCEKCGDFEVTQRITEDPLKKCPTCKRKVSKLISSTSFQLKGSGWYVTDYARKEKSGAKDAGAKDAGGKDAGGDTGGKDAGAESTAKSDGSTSSESKTESKSDKKGAKSDGKAAKTSAKAA